MADTLNGLIENRGSASVICLGHTNKGAPANQQPKITDVAIPSWA
ncbi:MAG TPA: hypothetical protein VKE40_17095 [Gemmataceae bacterium]|nr:hypothetical protein [Gemmataceae bacterium]